VIKNVVLHINGEQPLLADLFELPTAADVGVRCTNMRGLDGKRPVFIDDSASVFFFPYLHIRFLEIPPASAVGSGLDVPMPVAAAMPVPDARQDDESDEDLEIDEDFLRRIREV
jgi:hypothetical protein